MRRLELDREGEVALLRQRRGGGKREGGERGEDAGRHGGSLSRGGGRAVLSREAWPETARPFKRHPHRAPCDSRRETC